MTYIDSRKLASAADANFIFYMTQTMSHSAL